jgi:hypothetical protein
MNSTERDINPFEINSGSLRLITPRFLGTMFMVLMGLTYLMVSSEIVGIALSFVLIFTIVLLYAIFSKPKIGLYILVIQGFLVIGLSRYIPAPLGLSLDGMMIILYVALFFKGFQYKIPWKRAKSFLTLLVTLWFGYIVMQIANPEAVSFAAWFYAMRGLALYQFLVIPLAFILFRKPSDLNVFLIIWGIMSIFGTLKGLMQYTMGVDPFEQAWLNQGSYKTHILFGKLRVFSFYSDAGQFGAAQAHTGVVFAILFLFKKATFKLKAFYATVALLGFLGMIISGTRGAISVPAIGGFMFLILSKNIKLLTIGAILGLSVYVFFAHTNIGQGNPEIRRMRTAFDPNDASLQVRLANQKKLKSYLASRPIGGGVGATGNWGQRFTPHTFLANTATDSWYVMIWADTGVVGLLYYLFMLFSILLIGAYNVMVKIKNKENKILITALTCGFAGIMMASYGNGILGQMPTGILMYLSMVFMFIAPSWEKDVKEKQ